MERVKLEEEEEEEEDLVLRCRKVIPLPIQPFVSLSASRPAGGDAFNEAVFMRPGQYVTRTLVWLDSKGIDGAVNGVAAGIGGLSARGRRIQTGFVRSYALSMLAGAVIVVAALLLLGGRL